MKTSLTTLFIIPLEWNAFFAVLHKYAAMFAFNQMQRVDWNYSKSQIQFKMVDWRLERRDLGTLGTQAF